MTRVSTVSPHGKKNVRSIGKQHRQHMKTDDEWQRKHSMPAYCRPNHPKWGTALDTDDADDMNMETAHDA